MKKLFIMGLLALPLAAMGEEVADTTVTYNGKHIVISEDSLETRVSVFVPNGEEMKKSKESTFVNEQEVERFYVSSPFYSTHYEPTTPVWYAGFTGLTGSALGLGGADGVPNCTRQSFSFGVKMLDFGFWLNKKNTWGLSAVWYMKWSSYKFKGGNVLTQDADKHAYFLPVEGAKSSRLNELNEELQLMLKWYKYFKNPEDDRLCVGAGLTWEGNSYYHNFTSYKQNNEIEGGAACLRLNPGRFALRLQVSSAGTSIFVQKSLTPLFKDGFGPKCYPFTIGIGAAF